MAYVPFDSSQDSGEILTLEDFVLSFDDSFDQWPIYLDVTEIKDLEKGWIIQTEEFSVFCSHKYRKIAKVLDRYVTEGSAGKELAGMAVGVRGTMSNGWADWFVGKNTDLTVKLTEDSNTSGSVRNAYTVVVVENRSKESPISKNPDLPAPPNTRSTKSRTTRKAK